MTFRHWLLTFLLLTGHVQSGHTADSLFKSLNACIDSRFTHGEASEINDEFNLDVECPDLFAKTLDNKLLEKLDPPLDRESSLNQLLDARFLLLQARQENDTTFLLADKTFLYELQKDMEFEASPVELGLWDRFIAWLREHYKDNDDDEADWGWLIDFLEKGSMPAWLSKAIYYTSIGLIIVLAILIVVNELRAASRGNRRRRGRKNLVGSEWQEGLATIEKLDWNAIGKLPGRQQPGAMLRYVIDQMIERGWITNNRSRTNREMWRELRRSHTDTATHFDHAINLAERTVYGGEQLDDQQLQELYKTAQAVVTDKEGNPA